jgi:hypothetical protein
LRPAKSENVQRQPIQPTRSASGVVAVRLPTVPMDTTSAERVANRSGLNQRVNSLKAPIRLQAIPMPSSTRPAVRAARESPQAKTSAPTTATPERAVMVRRGPTRSRNMPMGIWVRAKA